jgi:hypothetical protein
MTPWRLCRSFTLSPQSSITAYAVIEQGRENGPVAHALQRVGRRGFEQFARLAVTKRRRAAFIAVGHGPLYPVDRVAGGRVALAEVIEQGRERGELAADRGRCQSAFFHILAPVDHMGPRDRSQPGIVGQTGIGDEFPHVVPVSPARLRVGDVGQPFFLGRNRGEVLELRRRQAAFFDRNQVHWHPLF